MDIATVREYLSKGFSWKEIEKEILTTNKAIREDTVAYLIHRFPEEMERLSQGYDFYFYSKAWKMFSNNDIKFSFLFEGEVSSEMTPSGNIIPYRYFYCEAQTQDSQGNFRGDPTIPIRVQVSYGSKMRWQKGLSSTLYLALLDKPEHYKDMWMWVKVTFVWKPTWSKRSEQC